MRKIPIALNSVNKAEWNFFLSCQSGAQSWESTLNVLSSWWQARARLARPAAGASPWKESSMSAKTGPGPELGSSAPRSQARRRIETGFSLSTASPPRQQQQLSQQQLQPGHNSKGLLGPGCRALSIRAQAQQQQRVRERSNDTRVQNTKPGEIATIRFVINSVSAQWIWRITHCRGLSYLTSAGQTAGGASRGARRSLGPGLRGLTLTHLAISRN